MITYLYWTTIVLLCAALLFGFGVKGKSWKIGVSAALVVLLVGWTPYYIRFQQVFVKLCLLRHRGLHLARFRSSEKFAT